MSAWRSRLVPYLRAEAKLLAALLVLAVVGVALEALLPWPLKLIVDNVLAGVPLPPAAAGLAALPGAQSAAGLLAWLAGAVLLVVLAAQALRFAKGVLEARLSSRMKLALGAGVFERLHVLSLGFHRRSQAGDLVRRVTTDCVCLPDLVIGAALPVVTSALTLVVLFAIMWQLDSTLALVSAFVAVPMAILMTALAPRMANRAYEHQEVEGELWSVAEQTLTALPVVQGFNREHHEKARFTAVADRSVRTYLRALVTDIQFKTGVDACEAAGIALVMLVGGIHALNGTLSIGTLIVFISYLAALYAPLVALVYLTSVVAAAMGRARRVAEILDAHERIAEVPSARPLSREGGRGVRVCFEGVGFEYAPGRPVLAGIDLDIAPGETVALIGPTGAGKTTLVSLVPRLLDPAQGRVCLDGQDVREASLESVRSACSFVLQEAFLLPVTVAENVAFGARGATREAIERAARAAGAHEFIERLEHGYDTPLGERGATLSGGQRQRLAIARALLRDAPLLIMDEPTSALDAGTEDFVLREIQRVAAGRTTIMIAHRLSTVRHADRVVVLDRGAIAAIGTHESLLGASVLYRTLYLPQMRAAAGDAVRA